MMRRWIVGNAVLAVGLLWVGINSALVHLYPLSWGGPNIGGGGLLLLAHVLSGAGLLLALSAVRVLWTSADDWTRSRLRWLMGRWVPAVATGLAAVVCAVMSIAPPGPGGSGIVGKTGVTVDANGEPVIVLIVCERSIDSVIFVGPYRGGPNEKLGLLTASGPIIGTVMLPLAHPPAGWSGGPVNLPLKQRPADLVIVEGRGEQSVLSQIDFTAANLAGLHPSEVLLTRGVTAPLDGISKRLCPAE